jgi:hypothetical protein
VLVDGECEQSQGDALTRPVRAQRFVAPSESRVSSANSIDRRMVNSRDEGSQRKAR